MTAMRNGIGLWLIALLLHGCSCEDNIPERAQRMAAINDEIIEPKVDIDLEEIRRRGKLVALSGYGANSYFIYKGEPMGFEYELLQSLSRHLGVELEIVVVRNLDNVFNLLNRGKGDLVAHNLTVTKDRSRKVSFTAPLNSIRQVLVQRLPRDWRQMKRHEIERQLITNPIDLAGKRIHVRKHSAYYARLLNLSDEIGGDIDIVEVPGDISTEELIGMVSSGEIDYTVADENIALINQAYDPDIDIHLAVSLPQRIAWVVRKNAPELQAAIDEWLAAIKQKPLYNLIYNKYYQDHRLARQRLRSELYSLNGGKISPYDELIRAYAKLIGWDWRMLAAQIYQESEFDPNATSWMGARGLMQLMPHTAERFGVRLLNDPEQNIRAGIQYLDWLEKYWADIPDSLERIKFVLASYNAGQGHVRDARNLAIKYNKDPDRWEDNVAELLRRKSIKKYYDDEVVQFGYCRGEEPVSYVADIFDRYTHYQKMIAQ